MVQIGPDERATLADTLSLSPTDFLARNSGGVSINELSEIFKRVISQTLGRPVSESRPLVANIHGQR